MNGEDEPRSMWRLQLPDDCIRALSFMGPILSSYDPYKQVRVGTQTCFGPSVSRCQVDEAYSGKDARRLRYPTAEVQGSECSGRYFNVKSVVASLLLSFPGSMRRARLERTMERLYPVLYDSVVEEQGGWDVFFHSHSDIFEVFHLDKDDMDQETF